MEENLARTLGTVANIWTYPVKSLRRVPHDAIAVVGDGLQGDRRAALFVTAPEHARLGKEYRGKEDNRLHTIVEPAAARQAAEERGVDLEIRAGARYFDSRPVSVILDRWIAEVEEALEQKLDPLRWRPNFFLRAAAVDGVREGDLVGTRIALGGAVLRVVKPIERCVTPTYDQETGESDPRVSRFVARERANVMGVYCEVEQPGTVRTGDAACVS